MPDVPLLLTNTRLLYVYCNKNDKNAMTKQGMKLRLRHKIRSVAPLDCYSCMKREFMHMQGLHRLEKYLNIQDCLEKSLKIKFVLKST